VQVELDSGKRVKVKAANVLLRFDKPAPAELMSQGAGAGGRHRPGPGLGICARGRVRLRRPGARLLRRQGRARKAGRGAVAAVRRAALLPPAGQGAVPQGARRDGQGRAAGHRAQEADGRADRGLGGRTGAGPVPGAGARAALPHPVQARQERARVQGRGRGRQTRASEGAAGPADGRRRHRKPLPVPLAALPVRAVPQGHGFPAAGGAGHQGGRCRWPPCRPSRSTTRPPPRSTTRCRCRAWAAARWCSACTSPRRAWPSRPDSALDKVARERLSTVYMPGWKLTMLPDEVVQAYTLIEGRDCPALSLYVTLDEATLEVRGSRDGWNGAHRRQPAPRPARRGGHRSLAHRRGPGRLRLRTELAFAFRLARTLKARREVVRGKPETFNRPDYNFRSRATAASPPATRRCRSAPASAVRRWT
jgi:exoribonuclease-2